jgi:hypothetical protein
VCIHRTATELELPESPALAAAAYELKFLLTEPQARAVADRGRGRLTLDPHADPALGGAYRITSLYCDTPQFDTFHRVGAFGRRKHRVRRYDAAPWVYLERKAKRGERVRKRRTRVPVADVAGLALPAAAVDWPGHWFHRHLHRRLLRPVCRVTYDRVAYVGHADHGPIRVTFDRHLRGAPAAAWDVAPVAAGLPLLVGMVVCEFKYLTTLPSLFKGIIHDLTLSPAPVSKYRTLLRATGRADDRRAADAGVA